MWVWFSTLFQFLVFIFIPRGPCCDETATLLLCSEYVRDILQLLWSASIPGIFRCPYLNLEISCLSCLPFPEITRRQLCCRSGYELHWLFSLSQKLRYQSSLLVVLRYLFTISSLLLTIFPQSTIFHPGSSGS